MIEESEIFREYFSRCMCDDNGFRPMDGRDARLGLLLFIASFALCYETEMKLVRKTRSFSQKYLHGTIKCGHLALEI